MIDENDNTSYEKGLKRLMLECGLVDIQNHYCEMDSKTCARILKKIDYVLFST